MIVGIDSGNLVVSKLFQSICRKPFYGHPDGCPNYGKKEGCPPGPLIDEVFDFNRGLYVIYTEFALGEFAERMRVGHPEWSEYPRQWYNPRRWQGTARKEHREEVVRFLSEYSGYEVDKTPEGKGVNVTELMKIVGVDLNWEWPPEHRVENKSYIVSLGGMRI